MYNILHTIIYIICAPRYTVYTYILQHTMLRRVSKYYYVASMYATYGLYGPTVVGGWWQGGVTGRWTNGEG